MGLKMPTVTVAFTEKGVTAIERSQRGIVALILFEKTANESFANVVYNVYTVDDIPKDLSDSNNEQIELCLTGYQTTPKKTVLIIVPLEIEITDAMKYLSQFRFDYLVIPEIKDTDILTVANWVKSQRENNYKKCKAILPNCANDYEGVINFTNTYIKTKSKEYTTKQYCSRIAGMIAGTPLRISCTYAPLAEVIEVESFTNEEMNGKIGKGELFIFFDGEKCKIARGINSFITTIEGKLNSFSKIKIVEAMDMIYDDIRTTSQDSYIGKYANSYDNKCLLISAIQGYFDGLIRDGILDNSYTNIVEIDLSAQSVYLESNGTYTKAELVEMNDLEIAKANTKDSVFLRADIKILDAIENIDLAVKI